MANLDRMAIKGTDVGPREYGSRRQKENVVLEDWKSGDQQSASKELKEAKVGRRTRRTARSTYTYGTYSAVQLVAVQ